MQQQAFRNRNDFKHFVQQTLANRMTPWILVIIVLLQPIITIDAAKYKGDNCVSKTQPGICKEWGDCPIIKTLIESGEYTNREVVSCGFGIREELICCPVIRSETKIDHPTADNEDRFNELTTTQAPVKDFWLDLLENTTTSTTAAPDFWLELLNPTTTTTTTLKPLIVGEQELNSNSEFFDFNALLSGNKNAALKREDQANTGHVNSNNNPANQGAIAANPGGRDHANSNTGQWSFEETGKYFNGAAGITNFRGNNNGNIGWGQEMNFNRGHNMGGGPFHSNGRPPMNGRNPHNNGRGRSDIGMGNPNEGGFVFPHNEIRPNHFFAEDQAQNNRPGRPVNNMQEQNPNNPVPNTSKSNSNSGNTENKLNDLIQNVFNAPGISNGNLEGSGRLNNQETPKEESSLGNIFEVHKPQVAGISHTQQVNSAQPVLLLQPQDNHNNHEVEYIQVQQSQPQIQFTHHQAPGPFTIVPAQENQILGNDLDAAPSTSFIQQPVVVETWPGHSIHRPTTNANPVEIVYQNLVNSGMNIEKAQDYQVENILNQQQQFGQQPAQIIVLQPQQPMQQFVQQPEFIYHQQPPQTPQNFVQQIPQQVIFQPHQMESSIKETRSTSPLQQFVPQTNGAPILHVQSPPTHILDPLKPFEFRPPPQNEDTFLDGNNALSTKLPPPSPKPGTKSGTDRAAVRACRRIEKGLNASLSQHILGGTPAELGEFPHMAAIGYSRIGGDDKPPYDIRCGGTLIDRRFVLTAAHCVSERENVPSIVRLGVVNFTDPDQMNTAVELRIKETYIHDDYVTRLTYNDIAVLELERDVEYSEFIYPVCLYTNETDPDTSIKLWVTGWGTVNTTTRTFSDILLKAPLHTSPLVNCNKSFTDYGLTRRIPEGIIRSQFCAEDKDQIKDACQGDSGGPLNLIVDESYKKYSLVGVVSSGFGCASSTPGLYTRVAAFLDFIEKVVWPNGGD